MKIPDQTKTTIKGGEAKVQILAAGKNTIARMEALLTEIEQNAPHRKDLTNIASDLGNNLTALVEAADGNPILAADAHVKSR